MQEIGIIGTGNAAWQLAHQFARAGVKVNFIAGRKAKLAKEIAESTKISFFELSEKLPYCRGIFMCISDKAIATFTENFNFNCQWIAHCSGSISIDAIGGTCEKAVFYPLQTMTKGRLLDAHKIPVCLEAQNNSVLNELIEIANTCGFEHFLLNSQQRLKAHVSAVFVNNFVNHILHTASDMAIENGIDQHLFDELAKETLAKFFELGGQKAQTGPAKRNDLEVIDLHKRIIASNTSALELYKLISTSIKMKNER